MSRVTFAALLLGILMISEARPLRRHWNVDPYHHGDKKHNTPESYPDNGAFFYPEQEFFDKDARRSDSSGSSDSNDDNFSGWYQDDEDDILNDNRIPTMPRDPVYDRLNLENGPRNIFGPDDVIHEVFPHLDNKKRRPNHILEEEHFGNEINDIDKIDELTRRMEQMHREMKELQHMLTKQSFIHRDRRVY